MHCPPPIPQRAFSTAQCGKGFRRGRTSGFGPESGQGAKSGQGTSPFAAVLTAFWNWGSIIVILVVCSCGCRTGGFTPQTLPPQFIAKSPPSIRSIDLISLSNTGKGGDLLQVGDAVEVTIATGLEVGPPPKYELRVAGDGSLDVPLIGPVDVRDARPTEAEFRIRDAAIARGLYVNPKITARLLERQTNRVTVAGAVVEPATYQVPVATSDLLTSLTLAKGFSLDADTIVEIRHPPGVGPQVAAQENSGGDLAMVVAQTTQLNQLEIDLTRLDAIPREHLELYDGSVVTVKRRVRRTVTVGGLVRRPGILDMPDDEPLTMLDAISQAGSTTISLADRVQIIRRTETGATPIVIEASIREAKMGGLDNVELTAGDIVSVEETPTTFVVETFRSLFNIGINAGVPFF